LATVFLAVDFVKAVCYNAHDNLIPIPWRLWCIAAAAEQDNRVKIPNGTAAVCAEIFSLVKAGHWK
jgi:hypothetical protein